MYRDILVTGGAGFIGSHVVDAFCNAIINKTLSANRIIIADIFDYCASEKNLDEAKRVLGDNLIIVNTDICNLIQMRDIFIKYNIDGVIHLAAQSHVDRSFGNSLSFTNVNVIGTHTLLEAAREAWSSDTNMHNKRFLHVSTDEVYGTSYNNEQHGESSLLQPTNPYAASKAAAEMYVCSYQHSYKIPTIISRSNNVYGPRQYPEKVIPKFILRLLNGNYPRLQGDGSQKRTFLYVTDAANALLTLFLQGQIGKIYNIGCNDEVSIVDLALYLSKKFNTKITREQLEIDCDRPFNDKRYFLSTDRISNELGWNPKIPFEKGINNTIHWYNNIDITTYWEQIPEDLFLC
jgi:dTDP-glucose 4,6-dehydratase